MRFNLVWKFTIPQQKIRLIPGHETMTYEILQRKSMEGSGMNFLCQRDENIVPANEINNPDEYGYPQIPDAGILYSEIQMLTK